MPKPRWMTNKDISKREWSTSRERKLVKQLGESRLTKGSGANWSTKGDIVNKDELIELKSTGGKQFTLHKRILEKVYSEAVKSGKDPVVVIDFQDILLKGVVFKVGGRKA